MYCSAFNSLVKRIVYQNIRVKHSVPPMCDELVTKFTFLSTLDSLLFRIIFYYNVYRLVVD